MNPMEPTGSLPDVADESAAPAAPPADAIERASVPDDPDPFAGPPEDPDPFTSDGDEDVAAPAETVPPTEGRRKRRRSFLNELPVLIAIALVVAVVIKTFLIQAFFIPSGSMKDTLEINDRVLVNKLSYRFGDVGRGDVIVFDDPRGPETDGESVVGAFLRNLAESVGLSTPQSEFIKRVIGLPGETVEIREGVIFINGAPLAESYLAPGTRMPDFGPELVPPDTVFVMGDNRNASQDSRVFGPIPKEDIVGRAFTIIWPPSNW
ncbi:MAG: signal peptidase I, partial [Acidimicrobiia bacterium]